MYEVLCFAYTHHLMVALFMYSTYILDVSDMQEQDPLADAIYIRANFTYIPRMPKELQIKAGDVFHILDEVTITALMCLFVECKLMLLYNHHTLFSTTLKAPSERFRSCFWVSRLNSDGTDEQIGPIPNSIKAQEYLEAQGESESTVMH